MEESNRRKLMNIFNELEGIAPQEEHREGYLRAPFSYAGSKYRCLDNILPLLPYRDSYIEPFGGSGSVLLAREPSYMEVFNDRYAGIIALYQCIRDKNLLDKLIERLDLVLHSREEFVWSRDTWQNCDDTVERAARWYYSIISSFSSLGRNFGRTVRGKQQVKSKLEGHLKDFYKIHNRLRYVLIENQDWRSILQDFDSPSAVFYLDPPYLNVSGGIYVHSMSREADHIEMLNRVFEMDAFVAVSGYDNNLYNQYPWTRKHQWEAQVTVRSLAKTETNNLKGKIDDNRMYNLETLWIKE